MAVASDHGHSSPSWFVAPGDTDVMAWVALAFVCLALYGLVTLYAFFDRWAEHQSKGTPLAKTIPTMLTIALLYEVFPLGHFNILLPLSAILIALMADWSRFHLLNQGNTGATTNKTPTPQTPEDGDDVEGLKTSETQNV